MNRLKTTLLLALLSGMLVFAGAAIGGRSGATLALFMAFIMNFVAYWFSDKIVLAMYGAKQVSESDAPSLFTIVRQLATMAQIPMPKVYIMENPAPNAFATGRNPSHAAVAVTSGILSLLNEDELKGVIAHELSHVRHRDILVSTVAATIAGAISYLAYMAQWGMMLGRGRDDRDESPFGAVGAILMIVIAPIAAMLIQLAISRSREYLADEGGARLSGSPLSLANALSKLHRGSQIIPLEANPATAHMFIVSPLTGGGFLSLFSTHPPIEERIARLEAMAYKR